MKHRLKMYLQFRKQSDAVKIMSLFALIAVVCLIHIIVHSGGIYRYLASPAEYVLSNQGSISQKHMDELRQSKDVALVSRQREVPITIAYKNSQAALNCTMVSKKYLDERFGASLTEGTKKIFMNKEAYSGFRQTLTEESGRETELPEPGQIQGETEFAVRYAVETASDASDGVEAPSVYKTAQLIVITDETLQEEGFVYSSWEESKLVKEADGLRVRFERHDLDGLHISNLQKRNFQIENEALIIEEEYEIQIKLLHIRYGLAGVILCLAAVFALRQYGLKSECRYDDKK